MSEVPIPPLDPGLASLFEREARGCPPEPISKAKVLAGVSRSVLLSMPVPGSSGTTRASSEAVRGSVSALTRGKIAALVAVAFLGGNVTGAVLMGRVVGPATVTAQPTSAMMSAVPRVSASGEWTPVAPEGALSASTTPLVSSNSLPAVGPTVAAHAAPSSTVDRGPGTLTREREVLDAARAALTHGQLGEALAALHEHETKWPHGALEEEREAMTVQALVAAGRTTAARERAAKFRRAFPSSMLIEVVSAAMADASP